jgi:hypothetical protein
MLSVAFFIALLSVVAPFADPSEEKVSFSMSQPFMQNFFFSFAMGKEEICGYQDIKHVPEFFTMLANTSANSTLVFHWWVRLQPNLRFHFRKAKW